MKRIKIANAHPNDIIRVDFRWDDSYIILKIKYMKIYYERATIILNSKILKSTSPFIFESTSLELSFSLGREVVKYDIEEIIPLLI